MLGLSTIYVVLLYSTCVFIGELFLSQKHKKHRKHRSPKKRGKHKSPKEDESAPASAVIPSGGPSIEELRQERLKREKEEQRKAEALLRRAALAET